MTAHSPLIVIIAALALASGALANPSAPPSKPVAAPQATQAKAVTPKVKGYLGMGIDKLPASVKAHLPDNIADNQGLIVTQFADRSPAADDGIKVYDVLLSYDDQPINDPEKFINKIREDKPGRVVKLKLMRQGQILTVSITLGEQKEGQKGEQKAKTNTQSITAIAPPPPITRSPQQRPYYGKRLPPANNYPVAPRAMPPRTMANPPQMIPRALSYGNQQLYPKFPMQRKVVTKKHAWGDKRNIWSDFYTDFTGDAWDAMMNAPFDVGRMPGGWRAPSLSTPDPVTIGDAVTNQLPPMLEEMGNMADFSD